MYTFLIFTGGFIGGFIFLAVIMLGAEKNNAKRDEQLEQEHAKEDDERMEWRRNKKYDNNSKTLKVIQLNPSGKALDTYYNNDEIFATFCIEELFYAHKDKLPLLKNMGTSMRMMDIDAILKKNDISSDIFELNFSKLIESGKVNIYSKTEGKIVEKIMRDDWGFYAGPLAGASGYEYFLPDGSLFLLLLHV